MKFYLVELDSDAMIWDSNVMLLCILKDTFEFDVIVSFICICISDCLLFFVQYHQQINFCFFKRVLLLLLFMSEILKFVTVVFERQPQIKKVEN